MSTMRTRWGMISTGKIAKQFARGLKLLPEAELAAVGSRAQDSADAYAQEFGVAKAYDRYEGVYNDSDVDVVYIATPHHLHKQNALDALAAGKHVLVEKPFTVNAREAAEVVQFARSKKLFAMEAFWNRFNPITTAVRGWLAEERIGKPMFVHADFGFKAAFAAEGRLYNLNLAGGALLDVGVYNANLASMVFGGDQPKSVQGTWHKAVTGVDVSSVLAFDYGDGRMASLISSVGMHTVRNAFIVGTDGRIEFDPPHFASTRARLIHFDGKEEQLTLPMLGNGYAHEAQHVMDQLRKGKTESEILPPDETVDVLKTLDVIRASWNFTYPFEK